MNRFVSFIASTALCGCDVAVDAANGVNGISSQAQIIERNGGSPPIIEKGAEFICTPVAVYDGDGPVWCKEGPRIRVAGIAAREADGSCRSNQPCPDATAEQARDALGAMFGGATGPQMRTKHIPVRGEPMTCRSTGPAVGSRTGAWCTLGDGRDLSCAMVETGTVLRWSVYWKDHRC